jgi:hypothetical protein
MTKKHQPPAPGAMMTQLRTTIIAPSATDDMRLRALQLAYEIGKTEGHWEGAKSMADALTVSVEKALT